MTVEVYSSPGTSAYQSTRYSATVNGSTAYVYGYSRVAVMPTQAWSAGATVEPAWFQFGADESATVVVTRLAGAITSAKVYPADKGATWSIGGGVLTITVPVNVRLWIECNGDRVPLIIQSRPLKPALPSPRTSWAAVTTYTATALDIGTETITLNTAHGWSAGQRVVMTTNGSFPAVSGTALSSKETYFVINPSGATLQLSRTLGGSAINFTGTTVSLWQFKAASWSDSATSLYFPAGVHYMGRMFRVGDDVDIYIDGGAVVFGSFDLRSSTGVTIRGAGQVFCDYALWADVQALPFEELIEYSPFLGLDFATFGYDNEVNGIMLAAWPYFFAREGVAHWENVLGVSPWNYNNDGFDCSVTLDGSESTVDHCLMFCGDDGLYLESNWFTLHATDLFVVNSNGGAFLFGYWGEANAGKFQKLTDCDCISLAISDEVSGVARAADATIKLWNDNREGEAADGYGRFNVQIRGLSLWGNFENRLLSIENYIYPFPGGLARDGLGDVADILLQDIVVEETPDQLSPINGTNRLNTPHDIRFVDCSIGGVALTPANFFEFFEVNAYPYNIFVGGRAVVTTADIANQALSAIAAKARVTSLSPPDTGSVEAEQCNRYFNEVVETGLELFDWAFARKRIAPTEVADGGNDVWPYCYEIPSDMCRVIAMLPVGATDDRRGSTGIVPDQMVRELDADGVLRLFTKAEVGSIVYTAYVTDDPNKWPPLFRQFVVAMLASKIAGPLVRGQEGAALAAKLQQEAMGYLERAKFSDANQQRTRPEPQYASWHQGRVRGGV